MESALRPSAACRKGSSENAESLASPPKPSRILVIDQVFRKLIKEGRSAAGPQSRPKSDRKASSHMLQASHVVVPSSCRWAGIARTCRAIDRHAHSSPAQHVPLSHAPLPVDSDAPEYAPPRTGRAQAVRSGKRGKPWQAARDGHWLGCWRVFPRFYASDHVLTRALQAMAWGPSQRAARAVSDRHRRALELQVVRYRAHM